MSSPSLDNNKNNCNSWCGTKAVAGRVEVSGKRKYGYARLRCKQWSCPECGPKKARKLQKAIEEKAREMDLTRFLTLTLDPKTIPPDIDQNKYLRKVWRKFRVYPKRKSVGLKSKGSGSL